MGAEHRFNNDLRYRDDLHPNQRQLTPGYVLEPVRQALGGVIDLDPCTEPDNPTAADRFYSLPEDGASLPWDADSIFVNPPYSKARERWVKRCIEAAATGSRVVLLMPSHTDTRIFQRAAEAASHLVFIKGRVKFGVLRSNRRQEAASHASCLIAWNLTDPLPLKALGLVVPVRDSAAVAPDQLRATAATAWAEGVEACASAAPWPAVVHATNPYRINAIENGADL